MTTAPVAPPTPPAKEAATAVVFDKIISSFDLFKLYSEVRGTLIQPRPGQVDKTMRIDRILVPTPRLQDLGWKHGIIGVELKPRDAKLGPAVAQAMDYSRSAWTLPDNGFVVHLSWVFVYPFRKEHGPLASVLAQHRIGTADTDNWTALGLWSGEANILRANWDNTVRIGIGNSGLKAGRR